MKLLTNFTYPDFPTENAGENVILAWRPDKMFPVKSRTVRSQTMLF